MTSRRSLLFAFVVAFLAFAATHLLPIEGNVRALTSATEGQPILDMKPSFSSDEVYQRLAAFGAVGRAAYRQTITTTDIVFPLSVFVFLFLLARYTAGRLNVGGRLRPLLLALPIAYFAADMAENAAVLAMLWDYPQRHDLIGGSIGYVTVVKRVAQAAALLGPLVLLLAGRIRGHKAAAG
jgi:hypothetical protein